MSLSMKFQKKYVGNSRDAQQAYAAGCGNRKEEAAKVVSRNNIMTD